MDFFDSLFISLADVLGNQDGKALSQYLYGPKHKPVDPVRGSKGRQGVKPDSLSHDDRIGNHIDLLSQISDHQGQRKEKNQFCRVSVSHVFYSAHYLPPHPGVVGRLTFPIEMI